MLSLDLLCGSEWKTEDDSKGKLEDRLNTVLSRIYSNVKLSLDRDAERAERNRLEQIARERRELEQQRLAEQRQLEEIELKRRAHLVSDAENWKRAVLVPEYVAAVKERAVETILSDANKENLDVWITWAEHAADALDPLISQGVISLTTP